LSLYRHVPHPWVARRKQQGPVQVADEIAGVTPDLPAAHRNWYTKGNAWIAIKITAAVGSMSCAWAFLGIAVWGLPAAMSPGGVGLLYWVSGDLLQLTLLSVILVGQNTQATQAERRAIIQAQASDKRAEQTFQDAEAILHECLQLQQHLAAQDELFTRRGMTQ
jgi:hypothetical protein